MRAVVRPNLTRSLTRSRTTALAAVFAALLAYGPTLSHAQAEQAPNDHAAKPNSIPDQNATQEPSAKGAPPSQPANNAQAAGGSPDAFLNGSLNVPGGNTNSQTSPAKFSKQNDTLDKIPIMARGPVLSDQDKAAIWSSVKPGTATGPVISGPATELAQSVQASDWPPALIDRVPSLKGTKYVGLADKLLVVWPANRIVVEEIAK